MVAATPVAVGEIVAWLDALLDPDGVRDYGPNGLQVEAGSEVRRVATGVTSNLAFIEAAVAWGADLAVVHHGLFWDGDPLGLTGALGRRVRALYAHGLSLAAYHLPLDRHPDVGNAAGLARALGLEALEPAFEHRGIPVGCVGRFPAPLPVDAVEARVRGAVSPRLLLFPGGPPAVQRVGIVTGGAARDVREAIDRGCDLFLTGEAGEYSQATALEEGIHFLAAGHHRTERFGPVALAEAIGQGFPAVEARFFDVDNPA